MSFRISFYQVPKDCVIEHMLKQEIENKFEEFYAKRECIFFDSCTEIFHENYNDGRLYIVLYEDEDLIIGNVSKEQLYEWIIEINNKIISHYELMVKDPEYAKGEIQCRLQQVKFGEENLKDSLLLNLNSSTDIDKMKVSTGFKYTDAIFNFISLYKNFDFSKYQLIIYGS